jgi:prepilin-type N-terminal cleavage/methylation domain-containing protein
LIEVPTTNALITNSPRKRRLFGRTLEAAGMSRPSRRTADSPRHSERGFTIVELSVAMAVMGILTIMIIGGMANLETPAAQTQAIRDSSSNLDLAYFTLDSEVRYAYEIWAPYAGTPSTDDTWDVRWESTFQGGSEPTCTELKYNYSSGQLSQASWTSGSATTPSFKVLASSLTGSTDPFTIISNSAYQEVQLQVNLTAAAGNGAAYETSSSSVTFTALNSADNQPAPSTDTDCTAAWTTA